MIMWRSVEFQSALAMAAVWLCALVLAPRASAQIPVTGAISAHDPSPMIECNGRYYIYTTGQDIPCKSSADRTNWTAEPPVFTSASIPAWTTKAVPGADGDFWAPDVVFMNGAYYLYYSISTFGSQISAIGLATNSTLDPSAPGYQWVDQGPVIQSTGGSLYNTIDPSVLLASDGSCWMSFGSFWGGIYLTQLDPATGLRLAGSTTQSLATHPPSTAIEGSNLIERGGYFYLFASYDTCCDGVNSTYNIRVGRSTTVTGPYADANGLVMTRGGGTPFLESVGRFIGPGQAGLIAQGENNWFTYHYYDGANRGAPTLGLGLLTWSADNWPHLTNDWSSFYSFEIDSRETLGQFSGQLQAGATITNDPDRGGVVQFNGSSAYASFPLSVANASSFAMWVNWRGGAAGQPIFDFGANTNQYLSLTPENAATATLRFTITTNGNGHQQVIDAPAALPSNSWQHVAVTLNGALGKLYLNGYPVATNASVSIRPWQVKAVSNYLARSQSPTDPYFNGEIDSLRIYGHALSDAEILMLAEAHPGLAHRYSFSADATDSIGDGSGVLNGDAFVTNGAVVLDGAPGTSVSLPAGLVNECAAATVETWAVTNSTPVHSVWIVDPARHYTASYSNGTLVAESATVIPALTNMSAAISVLGQSMAGSITELRIYDADLSPAQILADYAAGPDALAMPVNLTASLGTQSLVLTWPSYAAGFAVESSPSLGTGASWTPAPASFVSNNMNWLTLPINGAAGYLRLRRSGF
jgi:hypothetical protein